MELLTDVEVRVLGSLVEKERTTPEYYPLSLNALVNACNQKSNREPVVNYDSATVGGALNSLKEKGLVRVIMGGDSRVPKYRHYFEESYSLTAAEAAVLDLLMLRGPQTVGELRGRSERLYTFREISEVEGTLRALQERQPALVLQLPRLAGQKEARFAHLLAGEPDVEALQAQAAAAAPVATDRVAQLAAEVEALREDMQRLREEFATFRQQFE